MRRALVLSGGGSRGAYEIGAWQAFSELGVRFQAVYGTSAGAINAALFAQGDLEKASSLWENINIKQLMNAENEDFAIDSMISRFSGSEFAASLIESQYSLISCSEGRRPCSSAKLH